MPNALQHPSLSNLTQGLSCNPASQMTGLAGDIIGLVALGAPATAAFGSIISAAVADQVFVVGSTGNETKDLGFSTVIVIKAEGLTGNSALAMSSRIISDMKIGSDFNSSCGN